MLHKNQKPISDDIYNSLYEKSLFNVPTGRGKTYILLDVALRCLKDSKKVIVSVPNNNLVKDMHKTAIDAFGVNNKEANIVIGSDNYISKSKLSFFKKEREILETYITQESLEEYYEFVIKQKDSALFFDDFENIVEYKDTAHSSTIKRLLAQDANEKTSFSEALSITNHFYLLSKIIYDKNFDASDYIILVDEVHQLADVAELILTDNFSVFEFKTEMHELQKEIQEQDDFIGKQTLLKKLKELYTSSSNMQRRYSSQELVGTYDTKHENTVELVSKTKKFLQSENLKYLLGKIDCFSDSSKKLISEYANRQSKMSAISEDTLIKNSGVYYSPSRGYPNVKFTKQNVLGQLNYRFWKKISGFAGVSASVTSSFNPDTYEELYGYSRLGMLEKDEKYKYKIKSYERLFPTENVNIYLPNKEIDLKIESVYDASCTNDSVYYNYIVDYIYQHKNSKNSIVLCSGYKETKFLSELFIKKYPNERVHHANTLEKSTHTISRFKEEGGVLFGTRDYNTGISLAGDALECLFILKLPFVDFTTKKWLDIKEKGAGLFRVQSEREMLISLMQTLGRLQRSETDKGDIHLLDPRYNKYTKNKRELAKKIDDILVMYGTVQKNGNSEPVKKERPKISMKGLFPNVTDK